MTMKNLQGNKIYILVHNLFYALVCSPDEICKNDKSEDVTYAETVSLEKRNHSYFENLITSHVLFLILPMMSCVPLIPMGFFLVAFKKALSIALTRKL